MRGTPNDKISNYKQMLVGVSCIYAVISCKNTVMKNEEIKKECEQMYAQIKDAEDRLKELRAECKHEKTFEGYYSWRVGNIQSADICEYCGSLVRYK